MAPLLSLMCAAAAPPAVTVEVKENDNAIDFRIGGKLATRYSRGTGLRKPIFYPVMAPGQVEVTRGFPLTKRVAGGSGDHPHHKSVWFTYGDVIVGGRKPHDPKKRRPRVEGVNFWELGLRAGKVKVRSVAVEGGSVTTKTRWQTAAGGPVMDGAQSITLRPLAAGWLLDFTSTLTALDEKITFADTKEGMFGIRVHDQLREKGGNGRLTNADGKTGASACWGQKSAWCDYSGRVDGRRVGVAIFDHPDNPHPACWHARNYGLLAANPFGRDRSRFPAVRGRKDEATLKPGESVTLRYGLYVHAGDVKTGKVAEAFAAFAGKGK